ncbi:MAM and LDL-receptor class A domain-containing protein 1-like [Palaemon carinicauda]|uniref:MAM and LDL-receptor class A domain-containing protein 1-like n=1 Tax=Palaemon carinicauda TaxID=392227 RepID=UPI0035B6A6BF
MGRCNKAVLFVAFWCFLGGIFHEGFGEITRKSELGATSSNCTEDQFECEDGTCISIEQRCNFVRDCERVTKGLQGSDEDGCLAETCSFENNNYCGWKAFPGIGGFTWVDTQAKDRPGEKGPPVDHTEGDDSGWYLLAKSGETQEGAETWLSPEIPPGRTSENCKLKFWYWLSGDNPGSIHILKEYEKGHSTEIWMTDGDQGEEWHLDMAPIGNMFDQNLTIVASRGETYNGANALDDFMFLDCQTPFYPPANTTCKDLNQFQCRDGMCALQTVVCDYSDDCLDFSDENPITCLNYKLSCDFEIGFCGDWQQDTDDTTNWIRLQASAEVEGTSPEADHTVLTGEGHYMLLNTAPVVEHIVAVGRISSPVLLDGGMECSLRLWYQFTGDDSGTLNIYVRVSYYEDGLRHIVKRTLPKNVWIKETVTFTPYVAGGKYRVVIEGTNNKFGKGNLVIDDLSMTPSCEVSDDQTLPGQDTVSTPSPICPPGQLTCNSGDCYFPSDRCNFQNDCSDGTDEQGCAESCDFETEGDLCGWYENAGSSIHWVVKGFPAVKPGPDADHNGDVSTHALSVSKETGPKGQEAVLQSGTYSGVSKDCMLEAWYYMASDDDSSSISLYIQDEQVM